MSPIIFDVNFDSIEEQRENEDALERYREAMIEHVVLQKAFNTRSISSAPSVNERFLAHTRDCQRRKTDFASHEEIATFALSLMETPSHHFPAIAQEVREEVNRVDVSDLTAIIDPNQNPALKDLGDEDKGRLYRLSQNFHIQLTMKVERVHEMTFGGEHLPHSNKDRYNAWIENNVKDRLAFFGKGLSLGSTLIVKPTGLALKGGQYVSKQIFAFSQTAVSNLIDQSFKIGAALLGRSPVDGEIAKNQIEKKLEDFFHHGKGAKIPKSAMLAAGVVVVGFTGLGALNVEYSPLVQSAADSRLFQSVADLINEGIDIGSDFKKEYSPVSGKTAFIVTGAVGLMSKLAKNFKATFNFDGPSPLKENPCSAQSPPAVHLGVGKDLDLREHGGRSEPSVSSLMDCQALDLPVIDDRPGTSGEAVEAEKAQTPDKPAPQKSPSLSVEDEIARPLDSSPSL